MPSDRSRAPDLTRHGYTGVVAQQGRVVLDRDFNAQQSLTADRIAADALAFVGPCGTPDNGFAISLPGSPSSPPSLGAAPIGSPPKTPGSAGDFLISPGTMYLGGQRVYFPSRQSGKTIAYSYFDQPDWPAPTPPASPPPNFELIYLAVAEQEVSAVEDPDLLEVALAGPDTTQRLKLLSRIERVAVSSASCGAAWLSATEKWASEGWSFDSATMQLKPTARLKVSFENPGSVSDPCNPQETGGYLGADNQLIRLRIDRSDGETHVLWGFDDASFLYRVTQVANGDTLTLAADPPDSNHFPTTGQWVEVLTTASALAEEPDESNPSGSGEILRVVAEADGVLRQLSQPYGPLAAGGANVIVLSQALPAQVASSKLPLFLRVWQARQQIAANGGAVTLETTATSGVAGAASTGVVATLSGPTLADGAYWEIAVRPSTPQGVYPEDLLTAPQPPVGPRLWACPLAVIDWSSRKVADCRRPFQGLVALSKRRPGCCSVSINPDDVTDATPLQALIDKAAALADKVTVCLQPGVYTLPRTLYLAPLHHGMTLEGCGGLVALTNDTTVNPSLFVDGIVCVDECASAVLQGLTLRPPLAESTEAFFESLLKTLTQDGFTEAARVLRRPFVSFGVRAYGAPGLTIRNCDIDFAAKNAPRNQKLSGGERSELIKRVIGAADVFAAALFVQAECDGLKIVDCRVRSTIEPTYTPLRVAETDASPKNFKVFSDLIKTKLPAATNVRSDALELKETSSPPPAATELSATEQKAMLDRLFRAVPASPPPASASELKVAEPTPQSSPPPTEAARLQEQVSSALDLVAAKRLAAGTEAEGSAIVVVGVLAASSLDAEAYLGDALVRDCTFDNLTFATWFSADVNTLRIEDNIVSHGVAGLWMETAGAGNAPEPFPKNPYYASSTMFEEHELLVAFAATFPPPAPPPEISLPKLGPSRDIIILRKFPPFSLVLSGNQVNMRWPTTGAGSSAALLLAFDREGSLDPLTSIIVQSNRFCGGMSAATGAAVSPFAEEVPAALITLQNGTSCAVTGNVVINQGGVDAAENSVAPSLWLTVSSFEKGVEQLAVTGNVLKGESDLKDLHRAGLDANWSLYNANPS